MTGSSKGTGHPLPETLTSQIRSPVGVPHVRASVRGSDKTGEALPMLSLGGFHISVPNRAR
jgi:hypothetical protein